MVEHVVSVDVTSVLEVVEQDVATDVVVVKQVDIEVVGVVVVV